MKINPKNRPYEPCKELFFRYVPFAFLSPFEQQQIHAAYKEAQTYHTIHSVYLQYLNT
jgi:hypothetical protein